MDLKDCIVYLVFQLRNNGFEIRFTYPNILYISWSSYEREYFLKKNPIVQAMMPKPENVSKKGKNVRIQDTPVQNPYTDTITVAPVRRATEYVPPNSFLDNIQRPLPNQSSSVKGPGNIVGDLWSFL
jgi:hypothetical protein